jgi:hypothetical protein
MDKETFEKAARSQCILNALDMAIKLLDRGISIEGRLKIGVSMPGHDEEVIIPVECEMEFKKRILSILHELRYIEQDKFNRL